jgi:MFS family permease
VRKAPRRLFYGWVVVWAVHVVLFTIFGAIYSFSSFFAALQAEFAANRADVSFAFAFAVFLYFAIGAVAGVVADRTHVRVVAGFGIACLGLGLFMASRSTSLTQFYLSFGLAIGFGVGCVYVPAIAAVQPWFVRRRALAAGIASSGIGLGTLVVPLVAVRLIEALGWRATLQWMALGAFVLGLAATLLLEKSPQKKGMFPDNDTTGPPAGQAAGMGWGEAVGSRTFALFFATILVTGLVQFMPFVHLARHAQDRGLSAGAGALLIGIIGVGSFAGRFVLTSLADRYGRRDSYVAMFVLMGLAFAWWFASLALPGSFAALAAFALVFGLGYGGFVGLAPPLAMGYFGALNLSGIIGLLYVAAGIGTLIAPTFAGWAYDHTASYAWPIASGMVVNGLAAWIALKLPKAAN